MAPPRSAIPETAIVAEDESIYLVKQRGAAGANSPAQRHQLAKTPSVRAGLPFAREVHALPDQFSCFLGFLISRCLSAKWNRPIGEH
jgi:hypothetical protein